MMGENNGIFLVGGDALVYLVKPMHKKYSTINLFGAIHLVRTYLKTNFSTAFPCTHLYTCTHDPPTPSIPPVAYVLNGWPISQQKNK